MKFNPLRSGSTVGAREIPVFSSELTGEKYLYLIAGVHGDEVEGVFVLKHLFEWLKDVEVNLGIPMVVVPIVNVDGYNSRTRVNANGVDLNRNLPTSDWCEEFKKPEYNPGAAPLSEPENVFLDELFKKFPPGFIYSFHSWKPIVNFNGDCAKDAELLGLLNHYPIAPDIGYPTPGSLGTYAPQTYNSPVITFECPKISEGPTLDQIWNDNRVALQTHLQSRMLLNRIRSK